MREFHNVKVGQLQGYGETACFTQWEGAVLQSGAVHFSYGSLRTTTDSLRPGLQRSAVTAGFNTTATTTRKLAVGVGERRYVDRNTSGDRLQRRLRGSPTIKRRWHRTTTTRLPSSRTCRVLIEAKHVPSRGSEDAQLTGLQNIISGYQCANLYTSDESPGFPCLFPPGPSQSRPCTDMLPMR